MSRQIVTQGLHTLLVGAWQIDARYLVETDEVHTAVQSLQQPDNLTAIDRRVVESSKADVLEGASALVAEIILPEYICKHIIDTFFNIFWNTFVIKEMIIIQF